MRYLLFAASVFLLTIEAFHDARAASICLPPSPLPAAPGTGAQSVSFTGSISPAASYSAIFWREPCASNPAISALYLRVSPSSGVAAFLRTLSVVQNGVQSSAYLYEKSSDIPLLPFAGLIAVPTTFLLASPPELTQKTAFDPNLPMTLMIYLGPSVSLPAYGAGAQDAIAPTIPNILSATVASFSTIRLTWSPSTDIGGSGLSGYKIERCNGASCTRFSQVGVETSSTYSDTGLNPGTTYSYRVRAYDGVGNHSGYSQSFAATTPATGGSSIVLATEFYHPGFDHYFITAVAAETASLLAGNVPPWTLTGNTFWVWTSAAIDVTPVCRLFSNAFAPKSGHFYSNDPVECSTLQAGSVWALEDPAAFYMLKSPIGFCPTGSTPLYRLYNDGQGGAPNHRYTIDPGIRRSMITTHWLSEGNGADGVFACVPDDGSVGYQQTARLLGGVWSFDFVRDGVAATDTFSFTDVRANSEPSLPWAAGGTNQNGTSTSAFYYIPNRNFTLTSPVNAVESSSGPWDYFEFSYTDDDTVVGCHRSNTRLGSGIGPCTPFTGSRVSAPGVLAN